MKVAEGWLTEMNILFDGEVVNAREITTWPGRLRVGDYLQTFAGLCKIKTVQPACPYIENINHYFTSVVAEDEWGDIVPIRFEHKNKVSIYRRRR